MSHSTSPNLVASHTHGQSLFQNIGRGNSIYRPLSRKELVGISADGRSLRPGPGPSAGVPNANQNAYRIPSPSAAGNLGVSLDESGCGTQSNNMTEQSL